MDFFKEFMHREQQDKLERYRILNRNVQKGEILFTGSSLMEQFPVNELLMTNGMNQVIYNRGTNDIGSPDYRLEALLERYEEIITRIRERLPEAEITMMAYYPVNETDKLPEGEWGKTAFVTRTNENIAIANEAIEKLAAKKGCRFVNVNEGLTDERGKLKKEFTIEGIHMYANGYQVVLDNLKKYL